MGRWKDLPNNLQFPNHPSPNLQSQTLPSPYRIINIRIENPTVRSFVLDRSMRLDAGQFVMAWLPGLDEKDVDRVVPGHDEDRLSAGPPAGLPVPPDPG